jgi:hypothetical protein
MIPNHHKRKHGSNMAKKIKGLNVAKNQKLNVEDHIASTPTGPRKETYPPCQLLIFHYLHRPLSRNYTSNGV